MAKWADYCIHAKRSRDGSITEVRCRMDDGSDNMPVKEHDLTRAAVILHIESKRKTFVTMRRSPANATQWVIGENIRVRTSAGGKKYLRTDANNIDADNLNNLPEF